MGVPFLPSGDNMEKLVESDFDIGQNTDGLFIKTFQEIPDSFLKRNEQLREASLNTREKEYMHVASIPQVVVDRWMKQGFNVFQESISACVARLKAEGLEYFLTTKKRV